MAKKTYSLDFGGATTGSASLGGVGGVGPDSTASGLRDGFLNLLNIGGTNQWDVTGTGPLTIHQPEELGNYQLTFDPGDLDGSPSFSVTQEWLPSVNLSVDDNTIGEPSGTAVVAFAIAATHTDSITVPFTFGGTANSPSDYTASTTSPVTIASGSSTATMSISVIDGHTFEPSETVTVTLGSITGGEAGATNTITITISDDDTEGPTMIVKAPTGLTLSAKLFERGSDTLVETVTLTERTNAKGVYEGEVTEPATGWHHVVILAGASPIGVQDVYLTADPVEHYVGDYCPIEDPSGLLATAGLSAADVAATVAAVITAEHGSGSYTTANISTLATASQLGSSSAQLLSGITDLKATGSALLSTTGAILDDTGTSGVLVANSAKTGYSLSASGLDSISVADPGAPSNWTTLPKIINGVLRFFWKKTVKDATTIKAYADDGTTVNATMTHSTSGSTETKGPAT